MRFTIYVFIAVMFFAGGILSAHAALDDGLILYFSFDKETGGIVTDGTGGGNNGTLASASITTDEKKVGIGSLEMLDQNASLEVESFSELEEYQDNSFVFWLHFIQAHNGAWSQIFAKKAPGSDRSPGVWICPNSLNIHYRFNPGNQGSGCAGPGGENELFETGNGIILLVLKRVENSIFILMLPKLANMMFHQITRKEKRSYILVKQDIDPRLSILMTFFSSTGHFLKTRSLT